MSDRDIVRFIGEVKKAKEEQAHSAMAFPKAEPFDHGVQVGVYQGLGQALEIKDAILRDIEEKERQS